MPIKVTSEPVESNQIHNWGNSIELSCVVSEITLAQEICAEFLTVGWISQFTIAFKLDCPCFLATYFVSFTERYQQNEEDTEQRR